MASGTSKTLLKLGSTSKKIESPLAKYNSAGQLSCVLCNTIVKSEMVWTAHVNGRQHREKVNELKKPKSVENQFTKPTGISAPKRKAEASSAAPLPKKGIPSDFFDSGPAPIKSILKNSSKSASSLAVPSKPVASPQVPSTPISSLQIPSKPTSSSQVSSQPVNNQAAMNQKSGDSGSVPEGFFDDPKLDAKVFLNPFNLSIQSYIHFLLKVRQIEYKDPVEEEWDKFQKEIHDEAIVSAAIQDEDQEESTVERQLEEIEDQMLKWGRVLQLEKTKDIVLQRAKESRDSMQMEESSSSSDDEMEVERFFDWRSKAT